MSTDRLPGLALRLAATIETPGPALPDRESVGRLCQRLLALLFPGAFTAETVTDEDLGTYLLSHLAAVEGLLIAQTHRALGPTVPVAQARELVMTVLEELPRVRELLATDVDAAFNNDPAAPDRRIIVLSYPSIKALAIQRVAHLLYRLGLPVLPRIMTEWVHGRTGIDIHPGATIGESFFIDHGTGVVIGETSRIGKHCVLYQGVGLVAWNPLARDDHGELQRGQANKRHPDLEDHVTIYAGATILGGDTVIGAHSVIGGGAWLTHSVEPWTVVTMKDPELNIRLRRKRD